MNFKFYIFGTPEKFALYPNNRAKIKYFKGLYSVSEDNEKMIIQRFENGQVFYSYFHYNLVNYGFQNGAFFGMAVAFKGKYCVDVTKLYQLFQSVYNYILKSDVLLRKPMDTKPVYFLVPSLNNIIDKIKVIEKYISTRISDEFSDADFKLITDKFKTTQRKTIKTLNLNKGNAEIFKALKRYNQVAVSTEHREIEIAEEEIVLKPQTIEEKSANETVTEEENNIEQQDTEKEKTFDKCNIVLSIIAAIIFVAVIFIIIFKNI